LRADEKSWLSCEAATACGAALIGLRALRYKASAVEAKDSD
jgi:hypothetical protein